MLGHFPSYPFPVGQKVTREVKARPYHEALADDILDRTKYKRLLTTAEAAKIIGCTPQAVWSRLNSGRYPFRLEGTKRLIAGETVLYIRNLGRHRRAKHRRATENPIR